MQVAGIFMPSFVIVIKKLIAKGNLGEKGEITMKNAGQIILMNFNDIKYAEI